MPPARCLGHTYIPPPAIALPTTVRAEVGIIPYRHKGFPAFLAPIVMP